MAKKKIKKKTKKKSVKKKGAVHKKIKKEELEKGVYDGRTYKVKHESLFTVYVYPDDGEILAEILEELNFEEGDVNVAIVNKCLNNDDVPEDMYRATFRVDPSIERELYEKIEDSGIVEEEKTRIDVRMVIGGVE